MSEVSSRARAVVADETWRPILAAAPGSGWRVEIEAAFARAVSLRIGGEHLTLLAAEGRPAPGALIAPRADFAGASAGTGVTIREHTIEFADPALRDRVIDLRGIEYVDCRLEPVAGRDPFGEGEPPYRLDPPGALRVAAVAELLAAAGRSGPADPAATAPPFERAVGERLALSRERFRTALAAEVEACDPAGASDRAALAPLRSAVAGLIGLGIGLTPSGDDYLVGALAMLAAHPAASGPCAALARCVRASLTGPDGAARTTPVSRHFLLAGCDRAFHHDLASAARAVLTGDAHAANAFAATAAIGSTSGADALHGLADAYAVLAASAGARALACAGAPAPTARPRAGSPARDPESDTP